MNPWKDLLQVAIAGTDRRALPKKLRERLSGFSSAADLSSPDVLLEAAVWLSAARKDQPLSMEVQPPPKIIIPEPDPRPTADIGRELNLIWRGPHYKALPELLLRLRESETAMPPEHLPALLEQAVKNPELRSPAAEIWGPVGRLLLEQNPEWDVPLSNAPPILSDNSNLQDQQQARRYKPEVFFEWVQKKWPGWKAAEKTRALQAMRAIGPFPEEEEFLESCLQERSQNVREAATQLLLLQPDSALSRELWAFVKSCFHFKKKALHLDLPELDRLSAQRFFLKPSSGRRVRHDLFGRMMSFIPPDRWQRLMEVSPEEAVDLLIELPQIEDFLPHLVQIGLHFSHTAWTARLLQRGVDQPALWRILPTESLIPQLPATHWRPLARQALGKPEGFFDENSPVVQVLRHSQHPWNESISLGFFRKFSDWITQPTATPWNSWLYQTLLLEVGAYRIPPHLAERLQALLPTGETPWAWREPLDRFYATLLFRAQLLKKIGQAAA